MAPVLKTGNGQPFVGSNPTPSAKFLFSVGETVIYRNASGIPIRSSGMHGCIPGHSVLQG